MTKDKHSSKTGAYAEAEKQIIKGAMNMTYNNHYPNGWYQVDPEKAAADLKAGKFFVHSSSHEERIRIIDILEADGFHPCEGSTKGGACESKYPLMIFPGNKTYSHLSSTMGAAAIAGSGRLISEKEFYIVYYYNQRLTTSDSSST